MKKKIIFTIAFVTCLVVSSFTVNAVSRKDITLSTFEGGSVMQGIQHDTLRGDFHSSIYTLDKTSGTIKVYNYIYRTDIFGNQTNKRETYLYVKEINKSYIYNSNYSSKAWTKCEWWNQTSKSLIRGNFYFSMGHDTSA